MKPAHNEQKKAYNIKENLQANRQTKKQPYKKKNKINGKTC